MTYRNRYNNTNFKCDCLLIFVVTRKNHLHFRFNKYKTKKKLISCYQNIKITGENKNSLFSNLLPYNIIKTLHNIIIY